VRLILLIVIASGCGDSRDKPKPQRPPCTPLPPTMSGTATHYDAKGTGQCSFDASGDGMVAAINGEDYDHAAWCGACLAVSGAASRHPGDGSLSGFGAGPDNEIVVRVVDQCPRCKKGDLDLSREAFALLAPMATGRIPIKWRVVPCDVQGPITYQFKDGSNPAWTAIQIRNHRYPIAGVAARDDSGSFRVLARADYNYFVATGLGPGPYILRVTDTRGRTLEDTIALGDRVARTGAMQFAWCQ
jgi:expansin (peptidoglycan-binding protein)